MRVLPLLLALLGVGPAMAQTLTMATGSPPLAADPHFFNGIANNALQTATFSRLTERDLQLRLQPSLALSWSPVGDTAWEFRLRPGIGWSDGQPFTAEDAAFSIQRARTLPNSPGGYGSTLRAIDRMEVVDALTLRVHTTQPHATLPVDLSYIAILPRHAMDGATTEDINAGRMTVTTGPYRLQRYVPNELVEMVRNDAYWGPPEPWARVTLRIVRSPTSRVAALLSGDVDAIDQVPSSDLPRLRSEPRITVTEAAGVRMAYLTPNHLAEVPEPPLLAGPNGERLAANPLRDPRVRQALSLAIARDQLAERVMEGMADPAFQFMPPGTFTHDPAIGVPRADPAAARRLLAEAGYPQGFRLTILSPNGSPIPNDARIAQAVAQQWTRIGVQTQVEALPLTAYAPRQARAEFGMSLASWGATYGSVVSPFASAIGTRDAAARTGAFNFGRYSNSRLDDIVARSAAIFEDGPREALLLQAVRMVAEDLPVIPLFMLRNAYATRRGLRHEARGDGFFMPTALRAAP